MNEQDPSARKTTGIQRKSGIPLNGDMFLFLFFTHAWIRLLTEHKSGHDTN